MNAFIARLLRFSCCLLAAVCTAASAQGTAGFPDRPIKLVVPFTSGGPADVIGRLAAAGLQKALGQPVVVDNRAGAGGRLGAAYVAKSPPDGYTLLLCNVGDAMAVSLYKSMPYDFEKDFAPVSLLASSPFVIAVNPAVPAQNFKEFLALAKAKPGTLTYGSAGIGVSSHLSGEALKVMAGIDIVHVPYKGQAAAMADLLGGQISFMFANPVTTLQQVRAGKLRALAVTGTSRFAGAPDIPTVAESGVPGYEAETWFGIAAPAGTPDAVVNKLSTALQEVMNSKEVRSALEPQGAVIIANNPQQFAKRIQSDIAKWREIIHSARISLD
jgi:tripartite-type tricarboxylate transporter receptor subunit TctC